MSRFEDNIARLRRKSPVLAALVGQEVGEALAEETRESAAAWFGGLHLEGVWVLYVFGLGQGHVYEAAREWLNQMPGRYLVFLEEHAGVVRSFLESEAGLLRDKRVHIELTGSLTELAQYYAPLPYVVAISPTYRGSEEVVRELRVVAGAAQTVAYQALHPNSSFYQLLYPAFAGMEGHLDGAQLFGKFSGVPAIICGAGPSLDKQLPMLRELEGRALIFAGGSALPALTKGGVLPHFGAGLSPHADEIDRFHLQDGFEVPFFWKARLNPIALDLIHGPKLYNRMPHPAIELLEREVGIEPAEPIAEGPTVTYYLTDLALKLGCHPVLYVGVDLAHTGGAAYAQGVMTEAEQQGEIEVPDLAGELVSTTYVWLHEREALGQLAAGKVINCTEGGIGVEGVENRRLAGMEFPPPRDLQGWVRSELARCDMGLTREKLQGALSNLKKSVECCLGLFGQMSEALAEIEERLKVRALAVAEALKESFRAAREKDATEGEPPPWISSGRVALIQSDLDAEPAYEAIFVPMIEARRTYHRRLHDDFLRAIGEDYRLFRWQRQLAIEQELILFMQQAAADNLFLLQPWCNRRCQAGQ